jgi:hypothetical protein
LSTVARARTLTVLPRLDGSHKQSVVKFLYESGLIRRAPTGASHAIPAVVSLAEADLSGIQLGTNLAKYFIATKHPDFATAFQIATEEVSTQSGAQLLSGADLSAVDLRHAHLDGTVQIGADLSRAKLGHADLGDADLSGANLSGARGVSDELLAAQANSLKGATMPNGQKYEDWLKERRDRGDVLTDREKSYLQRYEDWLTLKLFSDEDALRILAYALEHDIAGLRNPDVKTGLRTTELLQIINGLQ